MTAAVYVVGGPGDREDLRYSLRSLSNAPCITEVWIVGDVPTWANPTRALRVSPKPEKFENQRQSLEVFASTPDAPPQFYLFNDDMFIVEPVEGLLPTYRTLNPASSWPDAECKTRTLNKWHFAVMATAEWVGQRVNEDPWLYECHVPLLYDTATFRGLMDEYPKGRPFAAGELYPLAGIGGEGESVGNSKCANPDAQSLASKLSLRMPFLSCSPASWDGATGAYVRSAFPDPCKWEA